MEKIVKPGELHLLLGLSKSMVPKVFNLQPLAFQLFANVSVALLLPKAYIYDSA